MRFDTSLQQRLEQRMVLAPRMIQAMEILQLPLMALQERIDLELVANPVLELHGDSPEESPPAGADDNPGPGNVAETERELVVKESANGEDFERLSNFVDRWETYFEESAAYRPRVSRDASDPKAEAMQNAPDDGQTLQEFLIDQWRLEENDPRSEALGRLMIENLDRDGYLRAPLEELGAQADPPAGAAELEAVLRRVQRVGPTGVGARGIEECLLLQLQADPSFGDGSGSLPEDALEVRIIRHHLQDIEANRYPQMAKALGVAIPAVQAAVERIRALRPRPGAAINPSRTPPIIPDVRIEWDDEAGDYRVMIVRGGTPELYISSAYRRLIKDRGLDPKTREFVARNIRSARWLIDAIAQRRDTLQRVVESILKFQRPFFDEGPDQIRPLKMQEIADDVHLHVATISRAVADKYADTPWGIYALRHFFTGGTQNAEGQDVAWDQVRSRLKAVVDAEDKKRPLSDDQIVKRLKDEGLDVARRTVAKYREEMDIPSSRKRRAY